MLAYNGLYDGNPLREFYSEEDARAYFNGKVKAIRDVRIKSAKYDPLIVGGGSERDKIFAIIEDYCDGSERHYGGREELIGAQLIADNVNCSVENVKEILSSYGARIDGDNVWLNDRLQTERRIIANRPNHSDFVSEIRKKYFARAEARRLETSVYLKTAKYAHAHNEMHDYRESHRANMECKFAINGAINSNYDGMRLQGGFEEALIDKYGMERVTFIVATTINEHLWDGRYSRDNKEWAKTIAMSESEDERRDCCLNVHPAVLDGFADRIRRKAMEKNKTALVEVMTKADMLMENSKEKVKAYYSFDYQKQSDGTIY